MVVLCWGVEPKNRRLEEIEAGVSVSPTAATEWK
jgi:hypothetical protein